MAGLVEAKSPAIFSPKQFLCRTVKSIVEGL